jgi:hypothetical protein
MNHIKSSQPAWARGRWVEIVVWGTEPRTLRTRRHRMNGTKLESKLETPKANERTLGTLGTYSNWMFQETHFTSTALRIGNGYWELRCQIVGTKGEHWWG